MFLQRREDVHRKEKERRIEDQSGDTPNPNPVDDMGPVSVVEGYTGNFKPEGTVTVGVYLFLVITGGKALLGAEAKVFAVEDGKEGRQDQIAQGGISQRKEEQKQGCFYYIGRRGKKKPTLPRSLEARKKRVEKMRFFQVLIHLRS